MQSALDLSITPSNIYSERLSYSESNIPESLKDDVYILSENANFLRVSTNKTTDVYGNRCNIYTLLAIVLLLSAPIFIPMVVKSNKIMDKPPFRDSLDDIDNSSLYKVRVVSQEALKNLTLIQQDILNAVIDTKKEFQAGFNESQFKAELQDAVENTSKTVYNEIFLVPPTFANSTDEVKSLRYYLWSTNIKSCIEAFNEPLIGIAIQSLKHLAQFSSNVIPDHANELYQASKSFKVKGSAEIAIDCPNRIPNISDALQYWYALTNTQDNAEMRHKVQILEKNYKELSDLLFSASYWLSKVSPVYLDSLA